VLLQLLTAAYGTKLPIRNVRFHGESWRVSRRATGIAETAFMTSLRHRAEEQAHRPGPPIGGWTWWQ
jgi:hypothetical protein